MKTFLFLFVSFICISDILWASPILDQAYIPPTVTLRASPEGVFQSFQCGTNGFLKSIELLCCIVDGRDRNSTLTLWNQTADTVLGEVTISPNQLPEEQPPDGNTWVPFDFEPLNLSLQQGNTYFIEISQGEGSVYSVNWDGNDTGAYSKGCRSFRDSINGGMVTTDDDLGFKTYMIQVPEPHITSLCFFGIFVLLMIKYRTRAEQRDGLPGENRNR